MNHIEWLLNPTSCSMQSHEPRGRAVCPLLCPEAEGRDYYDICFTVRSGKIYIDIYIYIYSIYIDP